MIVTSLVKTYGEVYESKVGAVSFTVMTTSKEVDPPELIAVTVYVELPEITEGVPEITPVAVSKLNPNGKAVAIE